MINRRLYCALFCPIHRKVAKSWLSSLGKIAISPDCNIHISWNKRHSKAKTSFVTLMYVLCAIILIYRALFGCTIFFSRTPCIHSVSGISRVLFCNRKNACTDFAHLYTWGTESFRPLLTPYFSSCGWGSWRVHVEIKNKILRNIPHTPIFKHFIFGIMRGQFAIWQA